MGFHYSPWNFSRSKQFVYTTICPKVIKLKKWADQDNMEKLKVGYYYYKVITLITLWHKQIITNFLEWEKRGSKASKALTFGPYMIQFSSAFAW